MAPGRTVAATASHQSRRTVGHGPHRAPRPRPLVSQEYRQRIGAESHHRSRSGWATTAQPAEEGRWAGRVLAAFLVRVVAFAVPLAASVGAAVVMSRLVARPSGWAAVAAWWIGITAVSTVVLLAVDRLARRLLPLAALLKLSMVFPDRAPSRFAVAFRAGSLRHLEEHIAHAREHGIDDEPARAAEKILALLGAMNAHDRRTRGHCERVRAFNDLLAEELRLPEHDRDRLRWAALLHDIGKLNVSHSILSKPTAPTLREWAELQRHPEHGARLAAPLQGWLGPWADTIAEHHERWDGKGYPHGLSGEEISFGGRIVAVADAFEVMTAPRPYHRPVSPRAAREELARCAGTHFDPVVVRAFLNISIGRIRRVMGPVSWLAQLPLIGVVPQLEGAVVAAGRQSALAAGTATGAGALAVGGVIATGTTPAPQHHPPAVVVEDAHRDGGTSAGAGDAADDRPGDATSAAVDAEPRRLADNDERRDDVGRSSPGGGGDARGPDEVDGGPAPATDGTKGGAGNEAGETDEEADETDEETDETDDETRDDGSNDDDDEPASRTAPPRPPADERPKNAEDPDLPEAVEEPPAGGRSTPPPRSGDDPPPVAGVTTGAPPAQGPQPDRPPAERPPTAIRPSEAPSSSAHGSGGPHS